MEVAIGTSKQQDLKEHLLGAQISTFIIRLGQDLDIFPLQFWFPWDQNRAQRQDSSSHLPLTRVQKTKTWPVCRSFVLLIFVYTNLDIQAHSRQNSYWCSQVFCGGEFLQNHILKACVWEDLCTKSGRNCEAPCEHRCSTIHLVKDMSAMCKENQ